MTPVAAFAAVIAMAGPQRLGARAAMGDAADDLAVMTAALRDGYGTPTGAIDSSVLDCDFSADDAARYGPLQQEFALLREAVEQGTATKPQQDRFKVLLDPASQPPDDYQQLGGKRACSLLTEAVLRDLGAAGVAGHSLAGTYSASLRHADIADTLANRPSDSYTSVGWKPADDDKTVTPCALSSQVVVYDAAHVAIAGDWSGAGWAAAQVWPDGARLGAEAVGRLTQPDPNRATTVLAVDGDSDGKPDYLCDGTLLRMLDPQGRPKWATGTGGDGARDLVGEADRVPFGG